MTGQTPSYTDIVALEQQANALRAQALRDGVLSLVAWLRGRRQGATNARTA
ncbi:MAG: RSP_7527 family protein [Paracoccaceae bacterium]